MTVNSVFSNSITYVKGLAILLVVLGHITSPLGVVIYSFHIPLFFFLGGVFIKTANPAADFLKKNFTRLIVPYFIFGGLGLFANGIKNILLHRPQEELFQSIVGLLFWMDAAHLQHYGFVLWFLPALFWARLVSFCLIKYLKINALLIFTLCVVGTYLFANLVNFTLPFGFDKGMVAMPWVFMGSVFYRHNEKILALPIWKIVSVVLFVLLITYFNGVPQLDMATKNIGQIFVTLPYTFSIIILIVYLAYNVNFGGHTLLRKISAFIAIFGTESMLVYVIHPYTNNGAYLLSTYFLGAGYWYVTFALTVLMLMAVISGKLNHQNSLLFKYL